MTRVKRSYRLSETIEFTNVCNAFTLKPKHLKAPIHTIKELFPKWIRSYILDPDEFQKNDHIQPYRTYMIGTGASDHLVILSKEMNYSPPWVHTLLKAKVGDIIFNHPQHGLFVLGRDTERPGIVYKKTKLSKYYDDGE